ncbi:glutamine synthetase, partial [Phenoliferia sp. Uapishka_3]
SLPFFLITFIDPITDSTLSVCPRGLLERVIGELKEDGFEAYAGAEYEYFNFKETPDSAAAKKFQDLDPLSKGMHGYSLLRPALNNEYFHDLYDSLTDPPSYAGHHTETGPGVYESALAYQPVARMADNATLFKYIAKLTGMKYGVMPTFMAKPYSDQPGCSGHVHISLRDKTGENIFAVKEDEVKEGRKGASYEDTKRISEVAEWFLAGVLMGLPSIVSDYLSRLQKSLPTKIRFDEDALPCSDRQRLQAPRGIILGPSECPVSYAYENRLASVRIISPPLAGRQATRLEVRVPGADVSFLVVSALLRLSHLRRLLISQMLPHYTFAAVLACGLYGIRNKLPLTLAPLNTTSSSSLPISLERLPKSLGEAAAKMGEEGSMARKVLGDEFVDHFVATRVNEWELFSQSVTSWETQRYFELA